MKAAAEFDLFSGKPDSVERVANDRELQYVNRELKPFAL